MTDGRGEADRKACRDERWEALESCPVCGSSSFERAFGADDLHHETTTNVTVEKCHECSAGFTNPRPTREGILDFYPAGYEQHQGHTEGGIDSSFVSRSLRASFRPLRELLSPPRRVELADIEGPGRVLDVGCGRGRFLSSMAERGWEAHGIDVERDAIDITNDNAGVSATRSRIQDYEAREPFDLLTMWHTLEHIHNPQEVLDSAAKLLRTTGRLLIEVPNLDSFLASQFPRYWYDLDVPRHLVHYTPQSLRILCQNSGFEIDSFHWRPSARSLVGTFAFADMPMVPPRPIALILCNLFSLLRKSSRMVVVAQPRIR